MAPSPSASNPSVGEYIRHIPATVWVTFKALVFGVVVLMCIGGLLMLAGFCFAAMSGFLGGFFSAAKKRWTENRRKKQMKKSFSEITRWMKIMAEVAREKSLPPSKSYRISSSLSTTTGSCEPFDSQRCFLLKLPAELRVHILFLVLPTHDSSTSASNTWIYGSVAILRVNHQLYEEGLPIMYGSSTMDIHIGNHYASFRHKWAFPGCPAKASVDMPLRQCKWKPLANLVQNWRVTIDQAKEQDLVTFYARHRFERLDSLVDRLRHSVDEFYGFLRDVRSAPGFRVNSKTKVTIELAGGNNSPEQARWRDYVLHPLAWLAHEKIIGLEVERDLSAPDQRYDVSTYVQPSTIGCPTSDDVWLAGQWDSLWPVPLEDSY
ncbi:uncharacterized protein KY384_000166 [Bacidia gigantensis]|uniref:uncharacterized protein n=1 Tax=Bacidia gigantensis TaxID=2732470 RepID=UPI001D03DE47|nr:uncharacterized protein KY384_000166 [Bacidia gigantensis]KAG8526173.1 hypothetical protein KY384_000166 [Bacidia gigantensis]